MKKLKERWGIESNWALVAILIVFAINGSFAAWVAKPVTEFLGLSKDVILAFTNYLNLSNLSIDFTTCWLVVWTISIFLEVRKNVFKTIRFRFFIQRRKLIFQQFYFFIFILFFD